MCTKTGGHAGNAAVTMSDVAVTCRPVSNLVVRFRKKYCISVISLFRRGSLRNDHIGPRLVTDALIVTDVLIRLAHLQQQLH